MELAFSSLQLLQSCLCQPSGGGVGGALSYPSGPSSLGAKSGQKKQLLHGPWEMSTVPCNNDSPSGGYLPHSDLFPLDLIFKLDFTYKKVAFEQHFAVFKPQASHLPLGNSIGT